MTSFNREVLCTLSVASISAAAIVYSGSAMAESGNRMRDHLEPHAYVGASYGFFRSRGGEFEDEDDVWGANAGVMLNRYLGVEGSYENFGRYGNDNASAEVDGFGVSAIGSIPVMENLNLYGKFGKFYSNVDVKMGSYEDTYEDDQFFYGAGAEIAVSDPLRLTVEYDRYKVGVNEDDDLPEDFENSDNDVDTLKAGARYRF